MLNDKSVSASFSHGCDIVSVYHETCASKSHCQTQLQAMTSSSFRLITIAVFLTKAQYLNNNIVQDG